MPRAPIRDEITGKLCQAVKAKGEAEQQRAWFAVAADPQLIKDAPVKPSAPNARSSSPRGPPAVSEPRLFLTEAQLAERWGVSVYTVYTQRRSGAGPRFIIVGKSAVRYPLTEVEAFEASESFASMGEVYARHADRARSRAVKRKALAKGRAVLAEARRGA
jgi:predicted DNA-binding transcriptional regulator AlpA